MFCRGPNPCKNLGTVAVIMFRVILAIRFYRGHVVFIQHQYKHGQMSVQYMFQDPSNLELKVFEILNYIFTLDRLCIEVFENISYISS